MWAEMKCITTNEIFFILLSLTCANLLQRRKESIILLSTQGSVSMGSMCLSRASSLVRNVICECLFPMVLHEMQTQRFVSLLVC